jgi:hypothetical protein
VSQEFCFQCHGEWQILRSEAVVKITYDHEVDALYIRFEETTVTTKHMAEGIAGDYDADGLGWYRYSRRCATSRRSDGF